MGALHPPFTPTLAKGDYGDVSPINGVSLGGGEHTMAVAVDVVPVDA